MTRPTVTTLLLVAAVALVGCGGDPAGRPAPTSTASGPDPTAVATCDALAAADPEAVAEAFGRAHDGLHELGRVLQEKDERRLAGDLLVAKQRVETLVDDAGAAFDAELRDALEQLAARTNDAVAALGRVPAPCTDVRSTP